MRRIIRICLVCASRDRFRWASVDEAVRVLNACEPQMHDRNTATVILERTA